ncbi:MAG: ABC transporter ATP-binding protein [Clostridia bacterium]
MNNVSFAVKKGEIFGFIGPNGAGKSTTIKMITGLSKITSGDIFICGKSVKTNFEKAISSLGGIIENPEMHNFMSGMNNLKYYASLSPQKIKNNEILKIAKLVGLDKRLNDKVSKYSLGMKQRLGIAQALLNNPKLIILDEPTNGLDVNGIIEIRKLLKKLAHEKGVAILVSSHILSEMQVLCDRIAIIVNGEIKQTKTFEDLKRERDAKVVYFINVNYPNFAAKILKDDFNIPVKISNDKVLLNKKLNEIPQMISHLAAKKILIFGAGKIDLTLEEEFLSVVKQSGGDTSIN